MRYPKDLKPQGTIGLVAPSFGCAIEPYQTLLSHTVSKLERRGYRFDVGPNCTKGEGFGISARPEDCAAELEKFYCSPQNDVLISVGGGELMCETVSKVHWDRIAAAEPKWFMGYSDNTNFTFLLNTLCDVASVYGSCLTDLGQEPEHPSCEDMLQALSGLRQVHNYPLWEKKQAKSADHPLAPYCCTEPYCHTVYRNGTCAGQGGPGAKTPWKGTPLTADGRITGGCLDVLATLCGTELDRVDAFNERYKEDGILWFLEACDLTPFGVRRALWQLKEAGWFRCAKGFLVGRPMGLAAQDASEEEWALALAPIVDLQVPVVQNVDIGHLKPAMPILSGSIAHVEAGEKLTIAFETR